MNRRNQNYQLPENSASLAYHDSKVQTFLNQEWFWIGAILVILFVIGSIVSNWLITMFGLIMQAQ